MKNLALITLAACLTSCTLTLHPDGSETYRTDPVVLAEAIKILAEK